MRAVPRSPNTIATRTDHLRRLARAFPDGPWTVTGGQLVAWAAERVWSREMMRSTYASIRSFYRWAVTDGRIAEEEAPAKRLAPVRPAPPRPRPIPERIYWQAIQEADRRTRLILRCAGELGMRRAEIAVVHARDLIEDLDGWTLVVHGKGQKDREVPLPPHLAAEIRWTAGRDWMLPGQDHGHLSPRWVGKLARRVLPGEWTIHTLRHRFSTVSYRIDRDLMTLRDVLGHTSVATTQRYIKIPDTAKRRLVSSVSDGPPDEWIAA